MESLRSEIPDPWGFFFISKSSKFNADSKNVIKNRENVASVSDNSIWTGSGNLSLLLRESS